MYVTSTASPLCEGGGVDFWTQQNLGGTEIFQNHGGGGGGGGLCNRQAVYLICDASGYHTQ